MAQQELDNNVALSEQRAKINNNALDAVSKSDTSDQALASNFTLDAGKTFGITSGFQIDATSNLTGVGNVTLGADKKITLDSSTTSVAPLIPLSSNGVKVIDIITQQNYAGFKYATVNDNIGFKNAAGTEWAFLVKENGVMTGVDTVASGSWAGKLLSSTGVMHSRITSDNLGEHLIFGSPSFTSAGTITTNNNVTNYGTTSDPFYKLEDTTVLSEENVMEQWAKLQKCLYGFKWRDKDGNVPEDAKSNMGYNAKTACEEDLQCGLGIPRASGTWDYEIGEKYGTEKVDGKDVDLIETAASVDQGKPTSLIAATLQIALNRIAILESKLQAAGL